MIPLYRITFRIYPQALLRSQAQYVEIEIVGIGESEAWLDEIIDARSEAVNESLTPGKNFQLRGSHIRVAGEPGVSGWGVFFVSSDGSAAVPVTDRLVDNQANYVAGIVPAPDPAKTWRVEVRTYYGSSGHFLKNLRTITLNKELTVTQ